MVSDGFFKATTTKCIPCFSCLVIVSQVYPATQSTYQSWWNNKTQTNSHHHGNWISGVWVAALLHQIVDIWLWLKNHSGSLIKFKKWTNEPLVSGMVWIMNLKPNLMLNTTILSPNPSSSVALPTGVVTPCPNWHLLCPLRFTLSPLAFLGSTVRKFDRINASFVRPSICASVLVRISRQNWWTWCGNILHPLIWQTSQKLQ